MTMRRRWCGTLAIVLLCHVHVSCTGGPTQEEIDLARALAPPSIEDGTVGPWKNRHSGNPELAGVSVQQFPDCAYESVRYEGKHPAMILFVMWDGRVNQVEYEPSGTVSADWWWKIDKKRHDYILEQLDYTHGSKPDFKWGGEGRRS